MRLRTKQNIRDLLLIISPKDVTVTYHVCTRAQVVVHAGACVWDGGERLAKYGRVWPVCHAVLLHAGSQPLASTPTHHEGRSGRNNSRQKSIVNRLKKIHKVERCDGKVKMQGEMFASCLLGSPKVCVGS